MVFSSAIFLYVFLPLVLLLYFLIPGTGAKNVVLLAFSLVFYAWGEPTYIVLMIISVLVNYIFGVLVHWQRKRQALAKWFLAIAVVLNLTMLFYFKYFSFAVSTLVGWFGFNWSVPEIALPIGISFYTFQGLSYVVDVYRDGKTDTDQPLVQKNVIKLTTYISMFPQLIAGPIVRYSDIHPLLTKRTHTLEKVASGVEVFIIGLCKKVIFANLLGSVADTILADGISSLSAPLAWIGALLYMLQIFYDFSGYSDMAIGLGRMFGFEFLKNFDYPYISRSITEFWRRWHISLSSWFRDYLYIPLGGNRRGNVYVNLSVVFLATGIWHGADWSFILWGLWHGAFMLIERWLKTKNCSLPGPKVLKSLLGWAYTMLVVFLGWVVFRLANMASSVEYFKVMFGITKPGFVPYGVGWYLNERTMLVLGAAVVCCIPWKQWQARYLPGLDWVWVHPIWMGIRRGILLFLLAICFLLITNSTYNPFIYFRF